MKIFVDSGSVEGIKSSINLYNISGITTNPKLVKTSQEAIKLIDIFNIETSIQVDIASDIVETGSAIYKQHPLSVIKVPISHIECAKKLSSESVPVNLTLCFSFAQVVSAANIGAKYVSIFVGRLIDNGYNAFDILSDSARYLKPYNTQIIAASIRNIEHFELAARSGCHIATVSPEVLDTIYNHKLTKDGLYDFYKNSTI